MERKLVIIFVSAGASKIHLRASQKVSKTMPTQGDALSGSLQRVKIVRGAQQASHLQPKTCPIIGNKENPLTHSTGEELYTIKTERL
jgi:hypothetical protein